MTWRIAINHRSGYEYRRPVTSSYNEARISPISSDRWRSNWTAIAPPGAVRLELGGLRAKSRGARDAFRDLEPGAPA